MKFIRQGTINRIGKGDIKLFLTFLKTRLELSYLVFYNMQLVDIEATFLAEEEAEATPLHC